MIAGDAQAHLRVRRRLPPSATRPGQSRARTRARDAAQALPRATERISYQIPVFEIDGHMVLYLAGFRRHYSIYPATERLIAALRSELAGSLHNRATIRFAFEGAIPTRLITRIAKLRAAEAAELAMAKATKKATKKATRARKHAARKR